MIIHATAAIAQDIVENYSLKEIRTFFADYQVRLRKLKYQEDIILAGVSGTKDDIKRALKILYTGIDPKHNQELAEAIETKASKEIPESLQVHQERLQNAESYKSTFENQADKYLKHCALNDLLPHPEVMENYSY